MLKPELFIITSPIICKINLKCKVHFNSIINEKTIKNKYNLKLY